MAKGKGRGDEVAPDQRALTSIQAARLSALTSIDAEQFVGLTVADIQSKFGWRVDARLLRFRRICGRVVKKHPITGVLQPVPFATVHVEDTDCGLISYFPTGWNWGWFFPFHCHREVLATVKTDRCGNFCVWVPRFDIDWILTWRKKRICFPDVFVRPGLKDLLPIDPIPEIEIPRPPRPGPDPSPLAQLAALPTGILEALGGDGAQGLAQRLQLLLESQSFGAHAGDIDELAHERAFDRELPPPLPVEFRKAMSHTIDVGKQAADPSDGIRAAVAMHLQRDIKELAHFSPDRYIGPFLRCRDVFVPEWHLVRDVPDITFRVTQDTNGDGTEETIYNEGFFDVRWNAGNIPNVTLKANSNAIASGACDVPEVPCGNVPAILFAGLMSLDAPYFSTGAGYATRPNRPKPPMLPRPAARTPFCGTLQLYGCVQLGGAVYYRVLRSTDNGATFSPMTNLPRILHPSGGGAPVTETPADGWYTVPLPSPAAWHPANMLIEWPTPAIGKHIVKVEIGNAAKATLATSAPVAIQVDNTAPNATFTKLNWKFVAEGDAAFLGAGRNLLVPCPTIRRGVIPAEVEVQFEVSVSAAHLRDAYLATSGCGSGGFALNTLAPHLTAHWHEDVNDNSVVLFGRYRLAINAQEGCYAFTCHANSRAMNPAGSDLGHLSDWLYDPVYVYTRPSVGVSVVNA